MKRVLIISLLFISIFLISGINSCKNEEQNSTCVGEGGSISLSPEGVESIKCCSGLTEISCSYGEDQCGRACSVASFCAKCGDGICKGMENRCNCPSDCKEGPLCGNGVCEEGECTYNQSLTCSGNDQTYCYCNVCPKDCS